MKTKEDKLKLLVETVEHYSKNPRSFVETKHWTGHSANKCLYFKDETTQCAIGRLIENKELCRKLDKHPTGSIQNTELFWQLPEDLQEYGQPFLSNLQGLHDDAAFWLQSGLTELGKRRVKDIESLIHLGTI